MLITQKFSYEMFLFSHKKKNHFFGKFVSHTSTRNRLDRSTSKNTLILVLVFIHHIVLVIVKLTKNVSLVAHAYLIFSLIFNDFLPENYMCVCMKNHVIRVYWLSGWIIVTWCIWYFMLYYWMIFCTFQVGKYIEGGRLKRIFFLSLSYYVRVCVCMFMSERFFYWWSLTYCFLDHFHWHIKIPVNDLCLCWKNLNIFIVCHFSKEMLFISDYNLRL